MDCFVDKHYSKELYINKLPIGPESFTNPTGATAYKIDKYKEYEWHIFLNIQVKTPL